MPATRLTNLRARKEMILAEADLSRQLFIFERLRCQRAAENAQRFVQEKRWWLLGGAAVAGLLIVRSRRPLAKWLPTVVSMMGALMR